MLVCAEHVIVIFPSVSLKASTSKGPKNPSSPAAKLKTAFSFFNVPSKGSTTVVTTGTTVAVIADPLPFST